MIGQTITHYKILEKLGEGGMGVVYKAQDTTLDRLVALKFLPEHVSAGSAELERFLQEAKAAAGLNHPNICTIHGIEQADGKNFIVMEFVDGQTLQEKKSSLSMKQSLDVGIQIAEGLAAAHEKGIVHRDIKPENIMFRKDGRVQIMDFGLAKLRGASRLTKEGSTVGTAGYMSPEQVQGQETDHRSDIFSLGVLLYEMLSGQPPFKGMHETAIAYEIVNVDSPPLSSIKDEISPELDAIVLDCLEKDPKERTQSASQVALELKRYRRESSRQRASRITASRPSITSTRTSRSAIPATNAEEETSGLDRYRRWGIFGIIAVAGVAAGLWIGTSVSKPSSTIGAVRSTVEIGGGVKFESGLGGHVAISPDGSTLAFVGLDTAGNRSLYVRPLGSKSATLLPGTVGANYPFWSPDNRSIAFFASSKMKRVDITGNPPLDIADAPNGRGGTWSPSGIIVFAPDIDTRDLFQVPASGGSPTAVTKHDTTKAPRFPWFLPDGRHFLYVRMILAGGGSPTRSDYESYVGSLDGESRQIPLRGVSNMMYADGHVVYLRQGTLIAEGFDLDTYEPLGNPTPIDNNVTFWPARAKAEFSVSSNGILVYSTQVEMGTGQLSWSDRSGRITPIAALNVARRASISPDEKRIAYDETDRAQNNIDVWVLDIERQIRTRFTFDPDFDMAPIWSFDGEKIFFSSSRSRRSAAYEKPSNGTAPERMLASIADNSVFVTDVSPDDRYLLLTEQSPTYNLKYADLVSDSIVRPILVTGFSEGFGAFSPDGRWIAYNSNESGRDEIYVMPFLREGGKFQVSTSGGESPFWGRSGEIFYTWNNQFFAVSADISGAQPRFGAPKALFAVGGDTGLDVSDVTKDGKRFLVSKAARSDINNSLALIVNWPSLINKK